MRTTLNTLITTVALLMATALQAHALRISTPTIWNTPRIYSEDIIIENCARLTLDGAATLTLTGSYNFTLEPGSELVVNSGSGIVLGSGSFITSPYSSTILETGSNITFQNGGQMVINGGTISCNDADIIGTSPSPSTHFMVNSGATLQGSCSIRQVDVEINTYTWTVPSGSDFEFNIYATFTDPSASNSHSIDIQGELTFSYGNFYFNTTPTIRLSDISLLTDGILQIDNSYLYAVPDIIGAYPCEFLCFDSYLEFEEYTGIDTQGHFTMMRSDVYCYTPANGWNGIYCHNSPDGLFLLHDTRLSHINTTTNDYAVKISYLANVIHEIRNCTIYGPTQSNSGTGIYVDGSAGYMTSCEISCTYVTGFLNGIYQTGISHIDLLDSELTSNSFGYNNQSGEYMYINGSAIHLNSYAGLLIAGCSQAYLYNSTVHNNAAYQIMLLASGLTPSTLYGSANNIYSALGGPYLVTLSGGSLATLSNCWWAAYPPAIGTEFEVSGGSTMSFPSWTYTQHSITGYASCVITPKSPANHFAESIPSTSDIDVYNYPNPFNPSTQIVYTLPEDMNVFLSVYSLDGKLIQTLNEGFQSKGTHTLTFNAPATMASGMYIYVLNTPLGVKSGTMLLTK